MKFCWMKMGLLVWISRIKFDSHSGAAFDTLSFGLNLGHKPIQKPNIRVILQIHIPGPIELEDDQQQTSLRRVNSPIRAGKSLA